jgi:hypothetical protein
MDMKKTTPETKKTAVIASAKPEVKKVTSGSQPIVAEKKEERKVTASKKRTPKTRTKRTTKTIAPKPVSTAKADVKSAEKTAKKVFHKTKKKNEDRVTEVYVQHKNDEILTKDIVHQIEEGFIAEGHRASTIKSLQVYLNIHEKKAYYVINGKAEGKFVSF